MRKPARTLVLIEQDGNELARLYDEAMSLVEEFDASSEEVAVMVAGLKAASGGEGPQWDRVLGGHSAAERAAARIFTLDV